jgi:AraC family transcriptional regulator of adaptative response/methylated-DNA-[protein]-cysteine methyltransferase
MHDPDQCWQEVQQRSRAADGRFVYAVRSTGVYCRPSCPARLARRENVSFHPSCEAAEQAGFRPCRRCDPRGQDPAGAVIAAVCRHIDEADSKPSLADLAAFAGYSPHHLHRLFKSRTGLTPLQYATGRRAERLRRGLADGGTVTAAIYDAGYNAASRFYAEAGARLGMAPSKARAGGAGEQIGFASVPTSLGLMLAAATQTGLCHVALGDDAAVLQAELSRRFPAASITPSADLGGLVAPLVALIEGNASGDSLPLDLRGTAFQRRVWQALRGIPPGATLSYGALAAQLGAPTAARAVASACAANPVAVAVPCHRVRRGDGTLGGYRWGVTRKQALLDGEAGH